MHSLANRTGGKGGGEAGSLTHDVQQTLMLLQPYRYYTSNTDATGVLHSTYSIHGYCYRNLEYDT